MTTFFLRENLITRKLLQNHSIFDEHLLGSIRLHCSLVFLYVPTFYQNSFSILHFFSALFASLVICMCLYYFLLLFCLSTSLLFWCFGCLCLLLRRPLCWKRFLGCLLVVYLSRYVSLFRLFVCVTGLLFRSLFVYVFLGRLG